LFYFKDSATDGSDDRAAKKQAQLKKEIIGSGLSVKKYYNPEAMGEMAVKELKKLIDIDFPQR